MRRRAESEEWLDNLRNEVEDVDPIEEYNDLESRADEPPSVIGEFSFVADVVDDKDSRNSESSDDSLAVRQLSTEVLVRQIIAEIFSPKPVKGNKSAPKLSNKDSDSKEKEREEDELAKGKFGSKILTDCSKESRNLL